MSRAQSKMSMNGFDPPGMYAKRDVVRMQQGNGMVDEGWLDQLLAAGIQQSGSSG